MNFYRNITLISKYKMVIIALPCLFLLSCEAFVYRTHHEIEETPEERLIKEQNKMRHRAMMALDNAMTHEQLFYKCMKDYASSKYKSSASAIEISYAGLSNCEYQLFEYKRYIRQYYDMNETSYMRSLSELEYRTNEVNKKTESKIYEVTEQGKQKAIESIINKR